MILEALVVLCIGAVLGTMGYLAAHGPGNFRELILGFGLGSTVVRTLWVCSSAAFVIAGLSYFIAFACCTFLRQWSSLVICLLLSLYVVSPYFVLLGWRALWGADGLFSGLPGLRMMSPILSYGSIGIIAVLTIRYLPIGVLLTYLRVSALPLRQIQVAQNLGLPSFRIHRKLYFRWSLPALGLVILFAAIFGSLDNLVSNLAGGGNIQIIANLLDDWQRSQEYQGRAMGLGLCYVLLVMAFLLIALRLFSIGESPTSRGSVQEEGKVTGELGRSIGILAIVTIVLIELSLVAGLLYFGMGGRAGNFPTFMGLTRLVSDDELLSALLLAVWIAIRVSLLGTSLAALSILARHIKEGIDPRYDMRKATANDTILLIPLITPPFLGGIAAGAFQGRMMGLSGSDWSIVVLHTVVFGPLAYFVIMAGMKKLSSNSYRVSKNLGLNIRTYARNILWPACRSTIVISILLVFTFSLNESVMARYVGGFSQPFGVLIANKQVAALDLQHYWVVSLIFILSLVALWAFSLFLRQRGTIR